MLRDLRDGDDPQAEAALRVIAHAAADVILLGDVDWDAGQAGVSALVARLAALGLDYPHVVARRPNSGRPSGADLDGNGRLDEPRDALGYGRFTGDSGIVLLSRLPLGPTVDHGAVPWAAGPLAPAGVTLPVATVAQWAVPLTGTGVTLVTLAAGPPVFDGPEDRNGHRNAAELTLARRVADDVDVPIVLGRANQDPSDGEGRRGALQALLDHPDLQDPRPRGAGGGGTGHRGDPALDTAAWPDPEPGPLRVDYVLPAATLRVVDAGVDWPAAGDPRRATVEAAGSGRLVWVDLDWPAAFLDPPMGGE